MAAIASVQSPGLDPAAELYLSRLAEVREYFENVSLEKPLDKYNGCFSNLSIQGWLPTQEIDYEAKAVEPADEYENLPHHYANSEELLEEPCGGGTVLLASDFVDLWCNQVLLAQRLYSAWLFNDWLGEASD